MEYIINSPAKIILFGEHYVVYGAKAIVGAMMPYNIVKINAQSATDGRGFLRYQSTDKKYDIGLDAKKAIEKNDVEHMIEAVYTYALEKDPELAEYGVDIKVERCWPLKGVGNSASLSAAVYYGLRLVSKKSVEMITKNQVYEGAQRGDLIANGPRASGVDATAVSMGGLITYKKGFGDEKNQIKNLDLDISDDWGFLLIDTIREGEKKASTKKQVSDFAEYHQVEKLPSELSGQKREKITEVYDQICEFAIEAFGRGDMEHIGSLMNENHALLKDAGMSCERIERAVSIAIENGAIGAKLSGAGGVGGVVVALARQERIAKIRQALEEEGFEGLDFNISKKGTHAKV